MIPDMAEKFWSEKKDFPYCFFNSMQFVYDS